MVRFLSVKVVNMYRRVVKRFFDLALSSIAIVVLAIPMLLIAIAIKIDDPGPVLFKQIRVGMKKNGALTYFTIWKFRSMKMTTPGEVPTRFLETPNQYITRVGKFIRKTSLDELPQIYQVFTSKMSIVGPRPVVRQEEDLIAERELYGANDVKPGITGWAQINGRDELDPPIKAKFDGEYVSALNSGFMNGFLMDANVFFKTFGKVLSFDGVVEGDTGEIKTKTEELEMK